MTVGYLLRALFFGSLTVGILFAALFLRHYHTDTLFRLRLPYRNTLSLGMAFCHRSQGIHY
jgi:hypothetical protein